MTTNRKHARFRVKVFFAEEQHEDWCREHQIPVEFSEHFDGGGYCFHVAEFQTQGDATAFMRHFGIESPGNPPSATREDGPRTRLTREQKKALILKLLDKIGSDVRKD